MIDNGRITRTNTLDGLGRLIEIAYDDGPNTPFRETIAYGSTDDCGSKNYVGRITSALFESDFAGFGEDYTAYFCYDIAGRLTKARHTSTDPTLDDFDLGRYQEQPLRYGPNGNLIKMSRGTPTSGAIETHAHYVGSNRLANTDGAGNDYRYDEVGRLIYNKVRGIESIEYDYFLERPLSLDIKNNGPSADFMYGASDRVFKSVAEGTGRDEILYGRGPDNSPLFEREQNYVSDVLTGQELTFYIYGPSGMVAKEVRTGITPPPSGPVSYYVKDHLGSTRIVLAQTTGIVEASYDYSPFGEVMRSTITVESRYTYTGQESDGESGLMNYHARLYDPAVGRFDATDPAGQFNSPYAYVGNNPVSFTDPSGEIALLPIAGFLAISGVKAIIGYAATSFAFRIGTGTLDQLDRDFGDIARVGIGGAISSAISYASVATGGLGIVNGTSSGLESGLRLAGARALTSTTQSLVSNAISGRPLGNLAIGVGPFTLHTNNFIVPSSRTLYDVGNIGQALFGGVGSAVEIATGGGVRLDEETLVLHMAGGSFSEFWRNNTDGGGGASTFLNMIFTKSFDTLDSDSYTQIIRANLEREVSERRGTGDPNDAFEASRLIAIAKFGYRAVALQHERAHIAHSMLMGGFFVQTLVRDFFRGTGLTGYYSNPVEYNAQRMANLGGRYNWSW